MPGQNAHVVIIGGGIAGTAAALALHRAGLRVVVCEAHPRTATDLGAFLTLASNGMKALGQFGAAAPISRAGFDLTSMSALDENGTELIARPLGEVEDELTRFRCLRWSELTAALQAEVGVQGIELRHGAGLLGAVENADGVTAELADGSTVTADLLIGADGLNSLVRTLIDPNAAGPRYAGQRVFYGYTSTATPPSVPGRITMVRGRAASFGYTLSPAGQTYWFARQTAPALEQVGVEPSAELRAQLLEGLQQDQTPTAEIVAATEGILVTNARDLPQVEKWRSERMLIIGDAAHAASPATGQGASMAFEDAVVLAKALRDSPDQDSALKLYEQVRRPRTEYNIAASAAMTGASRPPTLPPAPFSDEDVARHLEWDTPLSA
ncbi:FAD-dependent oxidoreductase [Kineosporia babensis]|uniref:FAD-dependent oxidoreductase n=1 Tax=Kineosporia babensis TaxID=499548 RepID=A0A9X1NK96_9ACTN|nr:FAD-dependent oxidoreductase [Kineosporia babensis]